MLLFVIYCNREPVPVLSSFNAKMQIWNVFWLGRYSFTWQMQLACCSSSPISDTADDTGYHSQYGRKKARISECERNKRVEE